LGRYGEKLAVEHLLARGFSLLARNYRTRRGEIDLIAFDGRTLIFVEVKTHQMGRSQPPASVSPLAHLSAVQLARYQPVAQAWLDDERYATPEVQSMRFDAIGVLVDAEGAVVDVRELYPEVVDACEEEGGVPSRLMKTDRRKAGKEGTPWQMFAGSPSGRRMRVGSRWMISRVRARAG
jgi:putative endonuclease